MVVVRERNTYRLSKDFNHARRPGGEGVDDAGRTGQGEHDDTRPARRAESILPKRVPHDDVALHSETDNVPHAEKCANICHVDHSLTPNMSREQVDLYRG